jgi:hypothetical protein
MQRTIRKLPPRQMPVARKKRVAAYARVSTGKMAALESLATQTGHYSSLIQQHRDWEYAGVFYDADTPYGHNPNSHKGTVLTRAFPVLAKKSMHGMFKSRYLGWQSYHELIRCIPRKTIIVKSDKSSNCTPFER